MNAIEQGTKHFEECSAKFGTVDYNGETLAICQQAYIHDDGDAYIASAVSKKHAIAWEAGEETIPVSHTVVWMITNPESEEEDGCCDWSVYTVNEND